MATQDVTTFVETLKDFRTALPHRQQMLQDHLIAPAQCRGETKGDGRGKLRTEL